MVVLVESKIPRKATTQIVMGILDEAITNTVKPLFECTDVYSRILLQLIFNFSTDSRRRFGNIAFYDCAGIILEAIQYRDLNLLLTAQIDRSRLMWAAKICLSDLEPINTIEINVAKKKKGWALKRHKLALKIGCNVNLLWSVFNWSSSYSKFYERYIEHIYHKYHKLLISKSAFTSRNSKMFVDQDQLFSNLRMAVGRAIDRCDVEQGTLTTMVEKCIMTFTNNPDFGHLYGIAFTVPTNVRRRKAMAGVIIENFSQNNDENSDSEDVYTPNFDGLNETFLCGIKKIRSTGITHLVLGLPIILSDEEKAQLKGVLI